MADDKAKAIPWKLMGVEIGTATGWDMQDTFSIIIYNLRPNEVGQAFTPELKLGEPVDLGVNFDAGTASLYDDNGAETILTTNWEVFNKVGGPGWQPTVSRIHEKFDEEPK